MFQSLIRSWRLVKASAAVLQQDRRLLVFPLVSGIAALIVMASFITPLALISEQFAGLEEGQPLPLWFWLWTFAFYMVMNSVIFFFNTALVAAAMIRLEGGEPTLADGFRVARARLPAILGYAAIAATLGVLLRMVEERFGFVGRWVIGFIGVAWSVATFMVVPVLVARDVGPIEAVKQSAQLLQRTWGENIIGQAGVGLVFVLVQGLVLFGGLGMASYVGLQSESWLTFGILTGLALVLLVLVALVQAGLAGVYSAALYRYAMGEANPAGFDSECLEHAFKRKA